MKAKIMTFVKDFLAGNEHLCKTCQQKVHRENYNYFSKKCDDCDFIKPMIDYLETLNPSKRSTDDHPDTGDGNEGL